MEDKLYDHYKDSNEKQAIAIRARNRFFLATLALIFLLAFFAYDPAGGEEIAHAIFVKYGINYKLSIRVLQTMLWCGVLYTYVRYLQSMTTVERGYLYLNDVEKKLRELELLINREGEAYSNEWPCLSKAIDILYKYFFIIVFNVVLISKAISEGFCLNPFCVVDWSVLVIFFCLSALYWVFLYKVDEKYK